MNESQAALSAETQATVVAGLGYPNNRLEASPEPTGWQPANGALEILQPKPGQIQK